MILVVITLTAALILIFCGGAAVGMAAVVFLHSLAAIRDKLEGGFFFLIFSILLFFTGLGIGLAHIIKVGGLEARPPMVVEKPK